MSFRTDSTELEQAEARIALLEEKLAESGFLIALGERLLDISTDAVFYTDGDFRIRRGNQALGRLYGAETTELEGLKLQDLVDFLAEGRGPGLPPLVMANLAKVGRWEGETRRRETWGEARLQNLALAQVSKAGEGLAYVGILKDVSELKSVKANLEYSSNHDSLTGLPNRDFFLSSLNRLVARTRDSGGMLAVCQVDLDDFKRLNNDLTRESGDGLLRAVGSRLAESLRAGDLIARTGGDEFSLAFPLKNAEELRGFTSRILGLFDLPFELGGRATYIGATMGVALCPEHGTDAKALLSCADLALQSRKTGLKKSYAIYQEDLGARLHGKASLVNELRAALEPRQRKGSRGGRFFLNYQPIIEIDSSRLVSTEALARWDHPEKGLIPPGQFIPLAEESGLILDLGALVLQTACDQARAWLDECSDAPRICVNVSAHQLQEASFVDEVAKAIQGLPPNRITLEITESQLFEDLDRAVDTLQRLKDLGVLLSVDDFGTGYASLSYLKKLPVDTVKIDQSFVADLVRNRHDRRIVEAVSTLARELGARTVAEGVETLAQFRLLREMGCDYAQGYLFGAAMEPSLILGLQREQSCLA